MGQAQLTSEQEAELSENEQYFNEFLKGFRIEDINFRMYSCLWDQHEMTREFNYTRIAFFETDDATQE